MEDIVARRLGKGKGKIGFQCGPDEEKTEHILDYVTPQDIRDFGMIPEWVGRFPVITHVESLHKEDLVRILTEPEDSLVREYRDLLEMDGVELNFDAEALDSIAEQALALGTGARGLRSIMESFMRDVMFNAPDLKGRSRTITVTRRMVG